MDRDILEAAFNAGLDYCGNLEFGQYAEPFEKWYENQAKLKNHGDIGTVSDSDDEESDYMKWWYDLSDHETSRIIIDSSVRKPIREYDIKNLYARYR